MQVQNGRGSNEMASPPYQKRTGNRTYIELSPQTLAVLGIERIASYVRTLSSQRPNWWFAIQDFDQALTSQLVAFLSGTTQLGALTTKHQKVMLDYLNDDSPNKTYPRNNKGKPLDLQIAAFQELLNRAMEKKFAFMDNSNIALELSEAQKRDLLKIH